MSLFRYEFAESVDMTEVEATFVLAIFATEALHGSVETRLHAQHAMSLEKRTCVVDAGTEVGRDLNRLFVGFLQREVGDDGFRVERIDRVTKAADRPVIV